MWLKLYLVIMNVVLSMLDVTSRDKNNTRGSEIGTGHLLHRSCQHAVRRGEDKVIEGVLEKKGEAESHILCVWKNSIVTPQCTCRRQLPVAS